MITSFIVTPSTGVGPYVFKAFFSSTSMIGSSNATSKDYYLVFMTAGDVGSCPVTATAESAAVAVQILENGEYESTGSVAEGSCNLYVLEIRLTSNDAVVSSSQVTVDNV